MSKKLEKGASFLKTINKLDHKDCAHFLQHLDDQGVELICRILHYVLNGDLQLHDRVRGKLRNKIKSRLDDFKRLATPPRHYSDIKKKRIILQRGGIIGILTAIASTVVPLIAQLIAARHR